MALVVAATPFRFPASGLTSPRGGSTWVGPANITANDALNATTTLTEAESNWLEGLNFGFTPGDFPAGAVIRGIEARILRNGSVTGAPITDGEFFLVLGGITVGTPQAQAAAWADAADPQRFDHFGGSSDLMGSSLTLTDVVDPSFGARMWCQNPAKTAVTPTVNSYEIRIWYEYDDGTGPADPDADKTMVLSTSEAAIALDTWTLLSDETDVFVGYTVKATGTITGSLLGFNAQFRLLARQDATSDPVELCRWRLNHGVLVLAGDITLGLDEDHTLQGWIPQGWEVMIETAGGGNKEFVTGVEQRLCVDTQTIDKMQFIRHGTIGN